MLVHSEDGKQGMPAALDIWIAQAAGVAGVVVEEGSFVASPAPWLHCCCAGGAQQERALQSHAGGSLE